MGALDVVVVLAAVLLVAGAVASAAPIGRALRIAPALVLREESHRHRPGR